MTLCTAVTAGVGAVACMVGAGALINLAKDAAQGDIHNIGDALGSMGTGALSGLAGGAGGMIAGKVGTLIAGKAGTGLMGRLATEAAENGVDEVINQAVTTGRVDVKSAALGVIPGLGALNRGGGGGGLKSAAGLNLVSVGGGGGGGCRTKHSFEPGTKVLMADGSSRPIADVNVGDRVLATDPQTGKSAAEPVTELHRNTDRELSDVTVKDQNGKASVLNTTQNHPFWNETNKKWSDAKDLRPGDELKVAGTGEVVVNKVRNYGGTKEMRDLTVADIHTYYVLADDAPVLVHNNDFDEQLASCPVPFTTRKHTDSAGNEVTRYLVEDSRSLDAVAEHFGFLHLDHLKDGYYAGKIPGGRYRKIELNQEGHPNTNEGPHVKVQETGNPFQPPSKPGSGEGNKWETKAYFFVKGHESFKKRWF